MAEKEPVIGIDLGTTNSVVATVQGGAPVVIRNASVFDSLAAKMLPRRTLLLRGGRIEGVGTPEKPIEIPAEARVIDGTGKYVLPGLIDAHVHLVHLADRTHVTGDELLPLFLASGVTSVRSAGDAIVALTGVAHFADFYDIDHVLVLGRVTSGKGGDVILNGAREVLDLEFPELARGVEFHVPDETDKRHGQAIAAASLPEVGS